MPAAIAASAGATSSCLRRWVRIRATAAPVCPTATNSAASSAAALRTRSMAGPISAMPPSGTAASIDAR